LEVERDEGLILHDQDAQSGQVASLGRMHGVRSRLLARADEVRDGGGLPRLKLAPTRLSRSNM
jgi:hypothetical protein